MVPISMKVNKSRRPSKFNWFAKHFYVILAQYCGHYFQSPRATISPIRMKLAVKDSLYQLGPMKVVLFRHWV